MFDYNALLFKLSTLDGELMTLLCLLNNKKKRNMTFLWRRLRVPWKQKSLLLGYSQHTKNNNVFVSSSRRCAQLFWLSWTSSGLLLLDPGVGCWIQRSFSPRDRNSHRWGSWGHCFLLIYLLLVKKKKHSSLLLQNKSPPLHNFCVSQKTCMTKIARLPSICSYYTRINKQN